MTPKLPEIEIYDHAELPEIPVASLERWAHDALPSCLEAAGEVEPPLLASLETIEVSLVDDATIAAVHGEFMDDPTPTDVITFHHGEILVSAETAARGALEHRHPPEREALLYVIHGLLHLNGHDDLSEPARGMMHAAQERILDSVWPLPDRENRG